jgi:hypothetical protein
MADEILKDMTHLGSTLADVATKQLDAVLEELSGARGAAGPKDRDRPRDGHINVGTLAVNLIELAGKAGQILTQLSKYDLVRQDAPKLFISSSNPISGINIRSGERYPYDFLLENDGDDLKAVSVRARVGREELRVEPSMEGIATGERRRLTVVLSSLPPGRMNLSVEVVDQSSKEERILATKTIEVTVLPPPTQPTP